MGTIEPKTNTLPTIWFGVNGGYRIINNVLHETNPSTFLIRDGIKEIILLPGEEYSTITSKRDKPI